MAPLLARMSGTVVLQNSRRAARRSVVAESPQAIYLTASLASTVVPSVVQTLRSQSCQRRALLPTCSSWRKMSTCLSAARSRSCQRVGELQRKVLAEMMSSQLIEVTASREQPSIFANAVLAKRTAPSSARAMAGTGYCSSISRAGVWRGSAIAESVARQERRHSNIHQPNCSYAVSPTYGAVSESARKHRKIRLAAARWFARREHAPLLHHSYQEACKLGDITLSMLFLGWPRGWPSRQATDE